MGKTFISACIVLAFLYLNESSKVITTAPTARQVEDLLWSEISALFNNPEINLDGKLTSKDLVLGDNWFATGISTQTRREEESAVRMRGYHAPKILVVVDEASGVHKAILEAVEDITSGENCHVLMISNPTTRACGFYRFCKSPDTNVIEMPAFSHPNILKDREVIPGSISKRWIRKQIQKHCEEIPGTSATKHYFEFEGKMYMPNSVAMWRLLAEFPDTAADTLIDYSKIEEAMNRETNSGNQEVLIALDVARFGDDSSVFCINENMNFTFKSYHHFDTAKITAEAVKLINEYKPAKFAVDCDGIGAGVYDNLNEKLENNFFGYELVLVEIHSSSQAEDFGQQEKFLNKRAQMFWLLREDISVIKLEKNDDLLDGLSSIKYFFNSKGAIQIEEKKDFKARMGRSSDLEDALVYCNFLRYDSTDEAKMYFLN